MSDKLGIPDCLLTHENVYKMICITFPSRGKKLGASGIQYETQFLFKVFDETSLKQRHYFFRDPLVQHLWQKFFIQHSPGIVTDYIRFVRTTKVDGDYHANRLLRDLSLLEDKYGILLIPKDPLKSEKFTDIEARRYIATNAKFFKRL